MKNIDKALFGVDLFGEPLKPKSTGVVAEKFVFPPFTVLDARSGEWQDRKRAWTSIGIKSELGREGAKVYGNSLGSLSRQYKAKEVAESFPLGAQTHQIKEETISVIDTDTSIFDPVVCELVYRWFCPQNGQVLDPFAGGSVRGIIAGMIGVKYWGSDLRNEQIEENRKQLAEMQDIPVDTVQYVCGDSLETVKNAPAADMVFSCPPYGDLEKYSDHPQDLSNMSYMKFLIAYREIIRISCEKLHNNRFACFVVADFRDEDGYYRNFVSETILAFLDSGLKLYNEAILLTAIGSAPLRVTRQFNGGRKLCKMHQNVLIFCKGDWKTAAASCKKTDHSG